MEIRKIEVVYEELVMHLKKQALIPILGSGFSCGSVAKSGNVPTGSDYKSHMVREIIRNKKLNEEEMRSLRELSFSQTCELYEDNEYVNEITRRKYLLDNFTNVRLNSDSKSILSINWPYIYTLNIDDGIESNSNYNCVIFPNREVNSEIFNEKKCVIKLHGDINEILKFKDGYKVFTSKEYLSSLIENNILLKKLQHDYTYQNIIFIGCSLDDEIDIKALTLFTENLSKNKYCSRIYYCTIKEPDFISKAKLKAFGITDVILFKNYTQMYQKLQSAGIAAIKISNDELENFHNFKIRQLNQKDSLNAKIFYNGEFPIDWDKKTINMPYFFIERSLQEELKRNLKNNTTHLVFGNRVSGKTFILLGLIKQIKDREVFYFSNAFKINNKAFNILINKKNALIIFDSNVLTKDQVATILLNAKKIRNNATNIVIALQHNDNEVIGIIKWKLDVGDIQEEDFVKYDINNKFSLEETDKINKLLPYSDFPVFNDSQTIIDNLSNAEQIMNRKDGRFFNNHIEIENKRDLVFYIIIAIKNKLYSSDIIKFGLDVICAKMLERHNQFIERIETNWVEKDGDYAPLKYVLNAKYWLFRELGKYADNKDNYKNILEAYKYIISKQIESTGKVELEIRKNCKDYIMFDTINQIFYSQKNGQLLLCEKIYEALHEYLAGNYQFLHQFAKCCLRLSYEMREKIKKIHYLEKGLGKAQVAATMIEAEYNRSNNENLQITLVHVYYTLATISSELCYITDYSNMGAVENAVNYSMKAIYSPYNTDQYLNDRKKYKGGIIKFLNNLINKHAEELNQETKTKIGDLLSFMMHMN